MATEISAKVIADSVSPSDKRITTLQLRFPRFILPQFNTHRAFSRNAASSRAIPTEKLIRQVQENPVVPIHWGKNQPGMQAREEIDTEDRQAAVYRWHGAALDAASAAVKLARLGVHKQVVNRILEPFLHADVIVTATEWDNFFQLRLHEDSQPEIQGLARYMEAAMWDSIPRELGVDEWHLPYVTEKEKHLYGFNILLKLSAARCARVSYLNHDQTEPDMEKDLKLADRLLEAGHMSPFEHQARAARHADYRSNNFLGWVQWREHLGK